MTESPTFVREVGSFQGAKVNAYAGAKMHGDVLQEFSSGFQALQILHDISSPTYAASVDSIVAAYGLTAAVAAYPTSVKATIAMEVIVKRLGTLAITGVDVDHDLNLATPDVQEYMNTAALEKVNSTLFILKGMGYTLTGGNTNYDPNFVDKPPSAANLQAFQFWTGSAEAKNVIQEAVVLTRINSSTLNLINTEYITRGNEIIFGEMEDLRDRQSTVKEALDILADVQNFHNLIQAPEADPFDKRWINAVQGDVTSDGTWVISRVGDHHVTKTYLPPPNWTDAQYDSTIKYYNQPGREWNQGDGNSTRVNKFSALWQEYADEHFSIDNLNPVALVLAPEQEAEFVNMYNRLTNVKAALAAQRAGAALEESSLEAKIQSVIDDMDEYGADPTGWILDNLNQHEGEEASKAGDIQRNITAAITAGTNLNDEKKEDLRRLLFVFEEFYKSASAIMQKATQLLEKMAANIAR